MDHPAHPGLQTSAALGVLLLVTLALTWPLPVTLGTHLPGFNDHPGLQGDLFFQWNLERQMSEGSVDHLASPYTLYPEGERFRPKVAFSLHLVLYVVLMTVFDLFTAHNLAVLLILFANAVAAWMLFRERTSSTVFALGCALLFAFGPWMQLKLDQGFVQKITLFHLPLFILFLIRVLEHRRRRDVLWCGFFLVIGALVYPPFAVFDVLLAAALIASHIVQSRERPQRLGPLAGLAAVMILIFAAVWIVGREDFIIGDRLAVSLEGFRSQGGYLDLFHPWKFFPYLGTFGDRPFQAIVERLPLGLPLVPLALATAAAVVGRRWARWLLTLSVGLIVLMAGPYLLRSGELVILGGRPLPMPFLLFEQLPLSQAFRFPIRIYPWMQLALLLASCEAVAWLQQKSATHPRTRRWAGAVPVVAAVLIVAEPLLLFPEYRGFHIEELRVPSTCGVATATEAGAALHLPFYPPGPHDYLMTAVMCDRPIVNAWQRNAPPLTIPHPGAATDDLRSFAEALSRADVAAVILHPKAYGFYASHPELDEPSLGDRGAGHTGEEVRAYLETLFGPAEVVDDGSHVFRVRSSDSRAE